MWRSVPTSLSGQVYAALAYYHANREEVDSQLAQENEEYDLLKKSLGPIEES